MGNPSPNCFFKSKKRTGTIFAHLNGNNANGRIAGFTSTISCSIIVVSFLVSSSRFCDIKTIASLNPSLPASRNKSFNYSVSSGSPIIFIISCYPWRAANRNGVNPWISSLNNSLSFAISSLNNSMSCYSIDWKRLNFMISDVILYYKTYKKRIF